MTWMLTASGATVDLEFVAADSIRIDDIAHHLAQINRYTGACIRPYSVAEHSLLVCEIVERECGVRSPEVLLATLMHDAHEAYTQDLSQPMKRVIGEAWRLAEHRVEAAVQARFNLAAASEASADLIHWADMAALRTERESLMPTGGPRWEVQKSHPFIPWWDFSAGAQLSWGDWRQIFIDKYHMLDFARGEAPLAV